MVKFKFKDRVKVVKLTEEKMLNIWGAYDDITHLLNQTGTVIGIIAPDTGYERYRLKFDDEYAQVTKERTGVTFSEEQLEFIG